MLLTLHHGDTLIDGPYSSVPRASCCPRWFVASQRRQVFALWVFGSFGLCLHSPWLCLGDVGGALRPCNNDGVSLVCRVVHGGSWRASDAEFLLCGPLGLWVFVCIAPGFISAASVGLTTVQQRRYVSRLSCCSRWFMAGQRRRVSALWVFGSLALCLHSLWLCLDQSGLR